MKDIIRKWYQRIGFPKEYDGPFEEAIIKADFHGISMEYGANDPRLKENQMLALLYYLYRCELLEAKYHEKGIPDEILLDTVSDIRCWSANTVRETGMPGLRELGWIEASLDMTMFKLGRLQCQMIRADADIPVTGIRKGDPLINLHIRQDEPFNKEQCLRSIQQAEEFFPKYFPEHDFRYFVCHSWLLDTTIEKLVKPTSNILSFQSLFSIVSLEESYSALRYVYGDKATPEMAADLPRDTTLRRRMAEHLENGGKLYAGYGIRRADRGMNDLFYTGLCEESFKLVIDREGKPHLPETERTEMTLPCAKGGEAAFGFVTACSKPFVLRLGSVQGFSRTEIGEAIRAEIVSEWQSELYSAGLMMDDDGCRRSDVLLKKDYVCGNASEPALTEVTIRIPEEAEAGDHTVKVRFFECSACGDERRIAHELTVTVHVYDVKMPKERTFVLDLWQHSSNIARKHDVRLWSDEHFAVLEQYVKSLASLGQGCITIVGSEIPWRGQSCYKFKEADLFEYSMIRVEKNTDGKFIYDYSAMRRYIDLCLKYGIDREIEVFGIGGVWKDEASGLGKLASEHPDALLVRYYDRDEGTYRYMRKANELDDYFVSLMNYFRNEGLEPMVRIAADEPGDVEAYRKSVAHLRELWPEVRFKTAINHVEFIDEFHEAIDVFSPYIYCVGKNWDRLRECMVRYPDKTFVWYICCSPDYLNTFIRSNLLESRYIGVLTAFLGLQGFLRWNYTVWPEDPRNDIRYGNFSAGDTNFVYPANNGGVLISQRYQLLKRGIEDFELISAVKKCGAEDILKQAYELVVREQDVRKFHMNDDVYLMRPAEELLSLEADDYHRMRGILLSALEKVAEN